MTERFVIGAIVYDASYGMSGLLVEKDVTHHIDSLPHSWDWIVLYEDGIMGYADTGELIIPTKQDNFRGRDKGAK